MCMYSQYRRLIKYMELARGFNHYILLNVHNKTYGIKKYDHSGITTGLHKELDIVSENPYERSQHHKISSEKII